MRRGNSGTWVLATVLVTLPLLLVAIALVAARESRDAQQAAQARSSITAAQQDRLECIATWANTWTRRAQQQADADRARLAALDRLARTLAHAGPAQWRAAVEKYLAASDRYATRVKAHPLPPAPRFLCDRLPSSTLPGPAVVTVTPAPSTVTRTVHATATPPAAPRATVTRPGPTRTVRAPRATVTRTVTETRAPVRPGPSHGRACVLGILC